MPWYELVAELPVFRACVQQCGIKPQELAEVIAYKIRPNNWQVFAWMGIAFESQETGRDAVGLLAKYVEATDAEHKERRRQASEAGRASGRARNVRCTPEKVAREYQTLMATGTEERNIAAQLARRFNVTPNHIRKLRKRGNEQA